MKLLLLVLVILFAAVGVTHYALEDPGYVLIARAPWSIEMSLTLFAPLVLVAFLLFALLIYVLVRLVRMPRDVARWRMRRRQRLAREGLIKGLVRFAEGRWAQAEALFVAGARDSDAPLIHDLGAAWCAQLLGMIEKRDEYLAQAHKHAPQERLAVGVSQAYLQYLARQPEQSLATLGELRRLDPGNRAVLQLLARLNEQLRDWPALVELIPALRESQALPAEEIDALERKAHTELLRLRPPSGSLELLRRAWGAVPKSLQRDPALIAIYARQLIRQRETKEAERLLRQALEAQWDGALVELYGQVESATPAEALAQAEGWLAAHPDDARLHLTIGRLALRAGDTAKARAHLEQSIALRGPAEAYRELGQLCEQLGDKDKAMQYYRQGLEALAAGPPSFFSGVGGREARAPLAGGNWRAAR
jgi:HemY protein